MGGGISMVLRRRLSMCGLATYRLAVRRLSMFSGYPTD